MSLTINKTDLASLKSAISRNPAVVQTEARKLFVRVGSFVDRFLSTSPWRVTGAFGGVPQATGELLRNARQRKFGALSMTIYTDTAVVPYAKFVHDGTSRMKARPYYDAAMAGTKKAQDDAIGVFLDNTIKSLAG